MSFTRRQLFGLGAAGVAAGASGARVGAAPPEPPPIGGRTAALIDPPVPGLSYLVVSAIDFFPDPISDNRRIGSWGVYTDNPARLYAPISLEAGSRLKEYTFGARLLTNSGAINLRPNLQAITIDSSRGNIGLPTVFTAGSAAVQTATVEREWVTVHGRQEYLTVDLPGGSDHQIIGVMVGYEPPPSGFVPTVPTRVYDSRFNMAPDSFGIIAASSERSMSIADGRDVATGAVIEPNLVPAGATAIAYNLTITSPTVRGFMSVNPASATAIGAASINWGPEAEGPLANAGIVQIDDDRRIRIFTGPGGAAHAIIDVTGYWL